MRAEISTAVAAIQKLSLEAIDARLDEIEQERFLLLAVRKFREAIAGESLPSSQEDSAPVLSIASEDVEELCQSPFTGRPREYKLYNLMKVVHYWDTSAELMSVAAISRKLQMRSSQGLYPYFREYSKYFIKIRGDWFLTDEGKSRLAEYEEKYEQKEQTNEPRAS